MKTCQGSEGVTFQQVRLTVFEVELITSYFIDFMKALSEDKLIPEQLAQAFGSLAHEKDHITDQELFMASMKLDILAFLNTNLPKKEGQEGAYDYRACKFDLITVSAADFVRFESGIR
jgi:hypothetical protein